MAVKSSDMIAYLDNMSAASDDNRSVHLKREYTSSSEDGDSPQKKLRCDSEEKTVFGQPGAGVFTFRQKYLPFVFPTFDNGNVKGDKTSREKLVFSKEAIKRNNNDEDECPENKAVYNIAQRIWQSLRAAFGIFLRIIWK